MKKLDVNQDIKRNSKSVNNHSNISNTHQNQDNTVMEISPEQWKSSTIFNKG